MYVDMISNPLRAPVPHFQRSINWVSILWGDR
jgi:hypothetical protein